MSSIAKFVSYDGGVAFSEKVMKIQEFGKDAVILPLDDITSVKLRRPQERSDGIVLVTTVDGQRYQIHFEEEQLQEAVQFRKQYYSFFPQDVTVEPKKRTSTRSDIHKRSNPGEVEYIPARSKKRPNQKASKPLFRRWWVWAIIVLCVLSGVYAVFNPADTGAKDTGSNPLMGLDVVKVPVMNGIGTEQIGERAYVVAERSVLESEVTPEQFIEFVEKVVGDGNYNWFTIDLNDGTGMQFTGTALIDYGYLDDEDCVAESIAIYAVGQDGHYRLMDDSSFDDTADSTPIAGAAEDAISVEITPTVGGEPGKPEFTISTNLPDETELMLTLTGGGFKGQTHVIVSGGMAKSEVFSNKGEPLSGDYVLDVTMSLPRLQSDAVRAVIGEAGENMTGQYIENDSITGENWVSASFTFSF